MRIKYTSFFLALYLYSYIGIQDVDAQNLGVLPIQVEVVAPSLTLTVSSSTLSFGRVTSDARTVIIDPTSGGREGSDLGQHSPGSVLLTGQPGSSYTVMATSPSSLTHQEGDGSLGYALRWANNERCERSGFEGVSNVQTMSGTIGQDGCARLQIGGVLDVDGVRPGRYTGMLTVHIIGQ